MNKQTFYPGFNDDSEDRDRKLKDELGETIDKEDLSFNEDEQSFEYDVKSDDPDYDHPDPYNTAVKNGGDMDSTYDEANPVAVDEYIKDESLEMDADKLGMHVSNTEDLEIDPIDEVLSRTQEDDRDDLDEEGYPKNDEPMK
ncbi:hypothetical protein [Mucilaginibacter paludis]|uniref:Uncharacterized protein n=1 Tax=Mucilaginibacter paludis DSM 18603 TaxID=714943 RepID=H1YBT5_9SPHI|nr:hypothetical protein [Mucilaginibacter paludis]EHQ26048.1 hypothetical protein Mucpa_1901 [Mucilaginibacter paludis DSM 18603]